MDLEGLKYCVVGCGMFGSVIAERIANDLGGRVGIIDIRSHVGGNCYSELDDETGIEVHRYGSHIFHTSNAGVWEYINRFTSFNSYRHQVLTMHQGKVYRMPINLETINSFYDVRLTPQEVAAFLEGEIGKEGITEPSNLEEQAISLVGRPLYEAFIEGYTAKQWQAPMTELPASIIKRLPVRSSYESGYFSDPWQGIPKDGYTRVFERMLASDKIDLMLGVDFFDVRDRLPKDCLLIYSGPIDRYFDYRHGRLGWRTVRFETEVHAINDYQGTAVMNYAERSVPFTRIHEFKHYHPERNYSRDKTVIFKEYPLPADSDEMPYYPIRMTEDMEKYKLYRTDADRLPNTIFGGRLGSYQYFDMHQVIAQALKTYESKIKTRQR